MKKVLDFTSVVGIVLVIGILSIIFSNQKMPSALILPVPFTAQAPTNLWDRNEDCEEASITMATAFLNGQTQDKISASDALKAINQLKNWEEVNIGYNANTGADATTAMAKGAFGLKVKQIKDYTEEDLKQALNQHQVILLPINAKHLGNPAYHTNGPLYHMIVVRGYRDDTFIINDPGTNSGDGNEYTFATLKNASADWDQTAKAMDPTRKIALILSK
ncbi:MAG TPA: C39 family peptidase [Methylomirabilota bacterium]|nr:C39 family peptidase [Methylomirabilota bacterium]